jgi:hydroxymethylpyrimidine pyrophosphatase-like HAD family hydrolase/energy-coupling factor transporter ATP-binding protein EcfA2
MRYFALATDYDGTLATHGVVGGETVDALERLVASGRKLVLVTGRQLDDLEQTFAHLALFDRVVAENGAVLATPATKEARLLDEPPPPAFVQALRDRGVNDLAVGRVIVATREPYEGVVLDTIREMGLELHVEFNKGAVMVLPAGMTKRTGLAAALEDMSLSPHSVVGVGDAENDHAFLSLCECAVSVANALPSLKDRSDWVTPSPEGAGVVELVDRMLADDLRSLAPLLDRRKVSLGKTPDGAPVTLDPYETCVLVTGPSGSGKSTLAVAILERLLEQRYQLCVIDPEGDHEPRALLAAVGTSDRAPTVDEVAALLEDPARSLVATLLAVPMGDRAQWFGAMRARIEEMRLRTGRPHWLIVDEAHHVLPAPKHVSTTVLPRPAVGVLLITVEPGSVSTEALAPVNLVVCTAERANESLRAFAAATGRPPPEIVDASEAAVVWRVGESSAFPVHVPPPRQLHLRHKRKYARGDLGEDKSFFFRGPRGALNLRAQNLAIFVQMASGVDDESWLHHLRAGDYSRWFREAIKDEPLADDAANVERDRGLTPVESRGRIREAIERRYTLPA